ncbi:MAG: SpoIIE family protein phosphatase [Rikenellaceae bacterium]
MRNSIFVDIACKQQCCRLEPICGDTFMSRRSKEGDRCVAVLSDGMGHGVKANVLSTLTATFAIFDETGLNDIRKLAQNIINTLPVCSKRKVSYSTFTIVEVNTLTGKASIVEFDNPRCLIYREGVPINFEREKFIMDRENYRPQTIYQTKFDIKIGDRIVLMSDGVTHSGLGNCYSFGWERENVEAFIKEKLDASNSLTSAELAKAVLSQAVRNDHDLTNDDVSCAVITLRNAKKTIFISCLPEDENKTDNLVKRLYNFNGKRIICGYPIASLIAGVKGENPLKDIISEDADLPPLWHMRDVDIVSEGLATLNKVYSVLNNEEMLFSEKGAAFSIIETLLESDEIHFVIGNAGYTYSDIYGFDEFKVRRNLIRSLCRVLETKYLKSVKVEYI